MVFALSGRRRRAAVMDCADVRVAMLRAKFGAAKACPGSPRRFTSAVGALRRLPCAARSCSPPPNSLRSLRSLRSDSGGESVHEARWRARLQALALQAAPGEDARPFARHKRSPGPLVSLLTFSALRRRAVACPSTPLLEHLFCFTQE